MKRILLFLFCFVGSFVANAQYPATGLKQQFKNGIALGSRDSTAFGANDSLVVSIDRNGKMIFRGNGVNAPFKVVSVTSDTAAMLLPYLRKSDTASMLAPYVRSSSLGIYLLKSDSLSGGYTTWLLTKKKVDSLGAVKLNISDTAAMLLPYARTSSLGSYLLKSDSLSGGYTTWLLTKKKVDSLGAVKLNISDTAAMLSPYVRTSGLGSYLLKSDSLSGGYTTWLLTKKKIDSLGAVKLNVLDTAAMLANRLKISDTAYMLSGYARTGNIPSTANFVPYDGATRNVNLGTNRVYANDFNLRVPSTSADTIGRFRWNADDLTANLGLTSSVVLQTGQELLVLVKNQTGVTIPNGTVVRQSGVVGASGRLKVEPFLANGTHNSNQVLGLTTEDIPNGGDGFVSYFGKVRGLNTAAYPDSTILYASPTVAGGLTNVVPEAPNNIVKIGTVVKSASSNGIIFTRVVAGSNINQDEGVQLTNPLNNSLLVYDSLTTLWKDKTLVEIGAVRVQDTAAMLNPYLRKSDTATMLSNYRRKTTLIENADLRNSAITINGTSTALGGSISVGTVTSVAASAGTGISVSGSPITSNGTLTITNTAPDQTVTLTAGTGISVSGTYPNFTVTNTSPSSGGTVTSVTASAPLSSSGGTTPNITISQATTSTNGFLSSTDWNTFNNKQAQLNGTGFVRFSGTTPSYITGTSSQFVKADGSLDGTSYATAASISGTTNYIPKFTSASAIGNSAIYDNGGNIGIGTNNPSVLLDIVGTSATEQFRIGNSTGGTDFGITVTENASAIINSAEGATGRGIQFQSGGTNTVLIDASGNLIVGGTSALGSAANRGNITINGSSSAMLSLGTGGTWRGYAFHNGTDMTISNIFSTGKLLFATNDVTKMTIDASGNLGLGVTPSAWSGAFGSVLQFKSAASNGGGALAGSGGSNFRMFANTFYDGSYKYIVNGTATQYEQDNYHAWYTAPSGTAGNPITFTQAMTLTANSELLVNTTTTDGTNKLIVNGGVKFGTGGTTTITAAGAATFSSSVTAAGATFSGTTAVASAGGTSQMRIERSGSVARFQNYDGGSASNISLNWEGGNVGIGTTSPVTTLDVNGNYSRAGQLLMSAMAPGILSGSQVIIRLNVNGTFYYLNAFPTYSPN